MRWFVPLLAVTLSFAQGTKPKPAPADYEVHAFAGPIDIGAEYMVHSFSNGEDMFIAERFLVVEVALYPVMKTDEIIVDPAKFGLRLNGRTLLRLVAPEEVAKNLRMPAWASGQRSPVSGTIGAGPIDVPVGGGGGQYPGQYPPQTRPMPRPPRAPEPDAPGGVERHNVTPEEVLMQTYLPAGPHKGPVSGFIYFPFTGKPASLKTVELEYGDVTLKLK